jgi:hypothetical protein
LLEEAQVSMSRIAGTRFAIAMFAVSLGLVAEAAEWTPGRWAEEDTLELRTTVPGEGEYWFPVWLVVIDDQLYVRLGSKAVERIEKNTTKPYVGVRVAGQQFERVEGIPVPDKVDPVARAMGDKYWSDLFIRFFPHPLTLHLAPP